MGGTFSGMTPPHPQIDYIHLPPSLKQRTDEAITEDVRQEYAKATANGYKLYTSPSCKIDNVLTIKHIPRDAWRTAIERVTVRPYILTEIALEENTLISITFIHGLSSLPPPPPPAILARAAVRDGCQRGEICAITHETLAELSAFCVGSCGHLFGPEAFRYSSCPLCRATVQWTMVKREEALGPLPLKT